MDNSLRSLIKKNNLLCSKITIKNNTKIINTPNGIYVFKKKVNKNIDDIYKYLYSRAFDYFPQKIDENEEYEVYEYIYLPSTEVYIDGVKMASNRGDIYNFGFVALSKRRTENSMSARLYAACIRS